MGQAYVRFPLFSFLFSSMIRCIEKLSPLLSTIGFVGFFP
jgi:hypothetical protein